jgi:hypothetical protein
MCLKGAGTIKRLCELAALLFEFPRSAALGR